MRIALLSITVLSLICSCGGSSPAPGASSPTAASSVRGARKTLGFVGQDGLIVEVVEFEDDSALLRVTGVETTLQDKVYRVQLVRKDGDLLYNLPWRGREWSALIRSGDPNFIGTYWVLRPPSSDVSMQLAFSRSQGEKVDAAALLALHDKQRESGELDKLQRYERRAEYAREEENLEDTVRSVNAECGSKLKAAVVWDTVDDKALQERSISSYCASALGALRSACGTPDGKQFVQQQVRQVSCRFDGNGEMSLNAGQLSWALNFELSDLDTLANRALSALPASDAQPN